MSNWSLKVRSGLLVWRTGVLSTCCTILRIYFIVCRAAFIFFFSVASARCASILHQDGAAGCPPALPGHTFHSILFPLQTPDQLKSSSVFLSNHSHPSSSSAKSPQSLHPGHFTLPPLAVKPPPQAATCSRRCLGVFSSSPWTKVSPLPYPLESSLAAEPHSSFYGWRVFFSCPEKRRWPIFRGVC